MARAKIALLRISPKAQNPRESEFSGEIPAAPQSGDGMGQAERLADNKDNGDYSSGGSESECDGIILFGTTTKLVFALA